MSLSHSRLPTSLSTKPPKCLATFSCVFDFVDALFCCHSFQLGLFDTQNIRIQKKKNQFNFVAGRPNDVIFR